MRDEPVGLDRDQVAGALREHWGIEPAELSYAPVGFGSYHWIGADRHGPRWFVTADYLAPSGSWLGPTAEDTFAAQVAAATSCRELADRGHEFVVAALPDRTGTLVRRVRPDWCVQVLPYLSGGWSTEDGQWRDPGERRQIAELVGRLHAADPPAGLRRWDFAVPARHALVATLAALDEPWTTGPYAERTRALLARSRTGIEDLFARYDALAREVAADSDPWVVTHGEPHSANVIRTDDGAMYLIDWDTVLLAPRERDLAGVLDGGAEALPAYQRSAGAHTPRRAAIELFERWWALAEICGYVQLFRQPHAETTDSAESWRNLCHYTPGGNAVSQTSSG